MTTKNNSKEINFRSKFLPLITEENRPAIVSAFSKFCSLSPEATNAQDLLWKMTYSPKSASWAIRDLGLNPEDFCTETVLKLRDELRYQYYKNISSTYLEPDISGEPLEAFTAFTELANKFDSITAYIVYTQIQYHVMSSDNVEKTLWLLSCSEENKHSGGLRNMGFSYDETNYLKKLHCEIYVLLKCLWDSHQRNTPATISTPFAGLDQRLKESGIAVKELLESCLITSCVITFASTI